MKTFILYSLLICSIGGFLMISCSDDFLEKPESSDVTLDTIFSKRIYAESFLWETYKSCVPRGFPYRNGNPTPPPNEEFSRSILASISDEGDNIRGATCGSYINPLGFWPTLTNKNQEDYFPYNYEGIREAYIFIENIDKVVDISNEEKEQMKAEAKTLIALRYQELLKRYGGVPIMTKSFETTDNIKVSRSSIADVVEYIVNLCDESASVLPVSFPDEWKGRVTRGVALSIKSRTLLFAASPFFNTGDMLLSYPYPEYVCYGHYEESRWERAALAALDVIRWSEDTQSKCKLINTGDPFNDYGVATSQEDNEEVILAHKGAPRFANDDRYYRGFIDGIYCTMKDLQGLSIPFNFLPQFRKGNGGNQNWDVGDKSEKKPFSDYTKKMNEMEPRFYQCAWVVGEVPRNFNLITSFPFCLLVKENNSESSSGVNGVAGMIKFHHNYNYENTKDWIVFRLAEFYLNFAEAANEFYGPLGKVPHTDLTALSAVNIIRSRGGLPLLTITQKDELRKEIKRERAIELFAEGHRNFDLRRWKEAEVMGGAFYGFRFVENSELSGYDYYYKNVFETRFWAPNQYLYPFPQVEIDKGYLVQNPGY